MIHIFFLKSRLLISNKLKKKLRMQCRIFRSEVKVRCFLVTATLLGKPSEKGSICVGTFWKLLWKVNVEEDFVLLASSNLRVIFKTLCQKSKTFVRHKLQGGNSSVFLLIIFLEKRCSEPLSSNSFVHLVNPCCFVEF